MTGPSMELIVLLLSLVITAVYCDSCPSENNPDSRFGSDMTDFDEKQYELSSESDEVQRAEELLLDSIGPTAIEALQSAEPCEVSTPNTIRISSIWGYHWHRNCEPCPPNAKYLWKFYNNKCFVIFPQWQQVRLARCSYKKCESPCACGHSKCIPTQWTRVWFWAWCNSDVNGWNAGINFYYLYLPQDCTCYARVFHLIKHPLNAIVTVPTPTNICNVLPRLSLGEQGAFMANGQGIKI